MHFVVCNQRGYFMSSKDFHCLNDKVCTPQSGAKSHPSCGPRHPASSVAMASAPLMDHMPCPHSWDRPCTGCLHPLLGAVCFSQDDLPTLLCSWRQRSTYEPSCVSFPVRLPHPAPNACPFSLPCTVLPIALCVGLKHRLSFPGL